MSRYAVRLVLQHDYELIVEASNADEALTIANDTDVEDYTLTGVLTMDFDIEKED